MINKIIKKDSPEQSKVKQYVPVDFNAEIYREEAVLDIYRRTNRHVDVIQAQVNKIEAIRRELV